MSNYKGYLPGMNPNRTRKIFQDDDDRYYAYESSTGRFVNNLGQEVKTAKEAIAFNDKLDAEYKQMFPPQKSVGAKPFRAKPQRMTPTKSFQQIKKSEKQLGNVNTLGAGVFYDFNSPVDKLLAQRREMEKSRAESIEAEKRFKQSMRTADEDKGKGLPGILGVDNA